MKLRFLQKLCLGIVFATTAIAQPLNWALLLSSVEQDAAVSSSRQTLQFLQRDAGSRLWDELELHYRMDGLDGREQRVELRVSPAGWGELDAEKARQRARTSQQELRYDIVLGTAVADRWRLGLQWLYRREVMNIERDLVKVFEDRIQVHLARSGAENFDPEDLMSSQERVISLRVTALEGTRHLEEIELRMKSLVEGWTEVALDTQGLPALDVLGKFLLGPALQLDSTWPVLKMSEARVESEERRVQLELARTRNWLRSVRAGYTHIFPAEGRRDNRLPLEKWEVGLAFRLPFGDGSGEDLAERRLILLDARSNAHEEKRNLETRLLRMRAEITSLLEQLNLRQGYDEQLDAGTLFRDYALRAGAEPLLLLKSRQSSLENDLRRVRLQFEVYLRYVDLLEIRGSLAKNPPSLALPEALPR